MAPRKRSYLGLKIVLIVIMLAIIAATAYVVKLCVELSSLEVESTPTEGTIQLPTRPKEETQPQETEPEETEPEETEPPQPVTASIAAQGDILMHGGLIRSCALPAGGYDFESHFRYMEPYISGYDYALANLETTFGGDSNPYQGWPLFNVPDELADAMVDAGYDMLLTANNHSYDTLMPGMMRTLEVSREKGLATLGTQLTQEEPRYTVADINGIQVGMVCYTFTTSMEGGKPRLNGNTPVENPALVNYFSYTALDKFYAELQGILDAMASEGAEATMLFIHWGEEYKIEENHYQNQIAQKVCDMGVDVIVGGHPHVVQPVELLQSATDPEHKTVCIYSLGNAVSNQRIHEMDLKTGHTEDGVLFAVTFEKDYQGNVYLSAVEALPTWVNLGNRNGKTEYNILPLDDSCREEWMELFNLDEALFESCEKSYDRTMAIVGPGIEQVNQWLQQEALERAA